MKQVENNDPLISVGWRGCNVRVGSGSYHEGMRARRAGLRLEACPYHGWNGTMQRQRLDWCAGWSAAGPAPKGAPMPAQTDLVEHIDRAR